MKTLHKLVVSLAMRRATKKVAEALVQSDIYDDYFFEQMQLAAGKQRANQVVFGDYAVVRIKQPAKERVAVVQEVTPNDS